MEKKKYRRLTKKSDKVDGYTVAFRMTIQDVLDRLALWENMYADGSVIFADEKTEKIFLKKC